MQGVDFSRDNLNGVTKLQGANFSGAIIESCKFEGAEYDKNTIFPDSFDPIVFKMRKINE